MSREIGIDLGTANVLIHLKGRGIVVNEPSVLAVDTDTNEVLAFGQAAYDMEGRTSDSIRIIHPLKDGVIADFDYAEALLVLLLRRIHSASWFSRPSVLVCAPSQISDIDRQSLVDVVEKATGGKVYLEEEALVAGAGSGVDLTQVKGNMIIDIGGGTTEIAVFSGHQVIESWTLHIAGDSFNQAIIDYFRDHYHLMIGNKMAEETKIALASAILVEDKLLDQFDVRGRSLLTGLPKSVNADSNDIYQALGHQLEIIANKCHDVLEDLDPELGADILDQGIVLSGGGALISNLDTYLSDFLGVSVIQADQPMACLAIGTGLVLDLIQSGKLEEKLPNRKQAWRSFWRRFLRRLIG